MSLSGYDSESVGFDSINQNKQAEKDTASQTTEFRECTVGSQTASVSDFGCSTELNVESLEAGYPEGLNEFLRRVVPAVMDQLDQNELTVYDTSESEEEEAVAAKLFQELPIQDLGSGDHQHQVLSITWSSGGSSFAVSIGRTHHESWCDHGGIIRVYSAKQADGDQFSHILDITEKNCINVVRYHPKVAAMLAYGTNSGEVVICNLQNSFGTFDSGSAMSASHRSRITALKWADTALANNFLMMHVLCSKKRRLASDQVLLSSSTDGCVGAWQVNTNTKVFESIVRYKIDGARKQELDITCFDFAQSSPLCSTEDKDLSDLFVVGTVCGRLYLCNMKKSKTLDEAVDPAVERLEPHGTCVLEVHFCDQRAGVFASLSMDSELRIYDVKQNAPMKVICMEDPISAMQWVPNHPSLLVIGLAQPDKQRRHIKVMNVSGGGRDAGVAGLVGGEGGGVTALAVHGGGCRVAAGTRGALQLWDMPLRRAAYTYEDYVF